jgi:hypothetical protein
MLVFLCSCSNPILNSSDGIRDKLDILKKTFDQRSITIHKDLNKSISSSNFSVSSANERPFLDFETRSDVRNGGLHLKGSRKASGNLQAASMKDDFGHSGKRPLVETLPINRVMELHEAIQDASDNEFDRLTKR